MDYKVGDWVFIPEIPAALNKPGLFTPVMEQFLLTPVVITAIEDWPGPITMRLRLRSERGFSWSVRQDWVLKWCGKPHAI